MNGDLSRHDAALAPIAGGSLARPSVPLSRQLRPAELREVDLAEQMDPLAVAESSTATVDTVASAAWQAALIAATLLAVWVLLPHGATPKPPLELPAALQSDGAAPTRAQKEAEEMAIALAAEPTRALGHFRGCVAGGAARPTLWRYYLQTLASLDERAELLARAQEFATLHPDRLESAHFLAEAIRRDDVDRHRRRGLLSAPVDPRHVELTRQALGRIDDALQLLQKQADAWPLRDRTSWADLLHLDRAHLHDHLWRCHGRPFDDDEKNRELALESLRQMSASARDSADALTLRISIYSRCLETWPWLERRAVVDGEPGSRSTVEERLADARVTLRQLPPVGRR